MKGSYHNQKRSTQLVAKGFSTTNVDTMGSYESRTTDTQRELFSENLELLGWGRHFGLKFFEAFGVFSAGLSAPICEFLVHVFHYSTIISAKKLILYIHITNIYLELGFEFGPQRIRDLAFVCP